MARQDADPSGDSAPADTAVEPIDTTDSDAEPTEDTAVASMDTTVDPIDTSVLDTTVDPVDTGVLDTTVDPIDTSVLDTATDPVDTSLVDTSVGPVDTSVDDSAVADTATTADTAVADSGPETSDTGDTVARLSVADITISEGNAGVKMAIFTVTLSSPATKDVSVNYATADGTAKAAGTAATGGKDYDSTSGTLIFGAGETALTVKVPINGDAVDEDEETFTFVLSAPVNAPIARGTATATITNDDVPPALSIEDAVVSEGQNGQKSISFNVTLSTLSGRAVTVAFATADGTATAPSDYVSTTGTLDFPSGQLKKTIQVQINGDAVMEPDETFTVNLSAPSRATLARSVGVGTIRNDD